MTVKKTEIQRGFKPGRIRTVKRPDEQDVQRRVRAALDADALSIRGVMRLGGRLTREEAIAGVLALMKKS